MIISCKHKSVQQPLSPHKQSPKKSPRLSEMSLKKLTVVQLKSLAIKLGCKGKFKNKSELILMIINCMKKQSTLKPSSRPSSRPSLKPPSSRPTLKPPSLKPPSSRPSLGLLSNIGNSCYLDSVLLSLLTVQNDFVDSHILNAELKNRPVSRLECIPENRPKLPEIDLRNRNRVQNELIKITNSIRGNKDVKRCTSLRKILESCPHEENFSDTRQKDAGEFLGYILNIFDTNVAVKQFDIYRTNDLNSDIDNIPKTDTNIDNKASIVHTIYHNDLINIPNNTKINSLLTSIEDSGELEPDNYINGYKRRVEVQTIIQAPYLIFNLKRASPYSTRTISTKIIPDKTIIVGNKSLSLSAIVVHGGSRSGGHYTAYLKLGQVWY